MPGPKLLDIEGRLVARFSQIPPVAFVWASRGGASCEFDWLSTPALALKDGVPLTNREAGFRFPDADFGALASLTRQV